MDTFREQSEATSITFLHQIAPIGPTAKGGTVCKKVPQIGKFSTSMILFDWRTFQMSHMYFAEPFFL
jgi:hypothetical protein